MPENPPPKRHLRVDRFHRDSAYKSRKRPNSRPVPSRANGNAHGQSLLGQAQGIENDYTALARSWEGNEDIRARGISVELESAPGVDIDLQRLEDNGWELLNERVTDTSGQLTTLQTWFVPDGKLGILTSIVQDYLSKTRKDRRGNPQPLYRPLIDAIERVGKAAAQQLWTEREESFPETQTLWFEAWLRRGASEDERKIIVEQFGKMAHKAGLTVGKGRIELPEHTILAVYGPGSAFSTDLAMLSCIAEIRRGRDYADFFDSLRPPEQAEWAKDLKQRTQIANGDAPYVSVLDTGINRGHPLLEQLIPEADNLTIEAAWSAADDDAHGTLMAGLCLYGDLTPVLGGAGAVQLPVHVDGAKIVPPPALRGNNEKLAGAFTAQGIGLLETHAPKRRRVWCIATTMKEANNPVPTSWSAQMDALASGYDNEGQVRRLLCLSAGNIPFAHWINYPTSNHRYSVENPSQSWNTLCVGAFTELSAIRQAGVYQPVASQGALAPTSSTSLSWDNRWPNKPDVVFEGGNAGFQKANNSNLELPELLLLSTHPDFNQGAFGTFGGTSSAAALAARFGGQIMAKYPELTPETVRGLIVHSAEWTQAMKASIPRAQQNKRDRANFLLRTVGYGAPNLRKALECAAARATLIAECEIQPFKKEKAEIVFNHMHLHALPWPSKELGKYSQERVRMRVTLSYFIEPNPGSRGTSHFRYPSTALRFKVSSPGQDGDDLAADVSKIALEEFEKQNRVRIEGTTDGWTLGQACFRGSIHSDIWEGTAADLLSMQHIAVYPVTGWWRTRPSHGRSDSRLKYSLIVTLETENQAIDILTEIENQIKVPVAVTA